MEQQTLANGRYQIERALGLGGMSVVLAAMDTRIGVRRAIKLLSPKYARMPEIRARFQNEAFAQAGLKHPNILMVHDVIEEDNGAFYMVMELAEGGSLAQKVRNTGPLSPREAAEVGIAIGGALSVAHKAGVIHRDIKPHNILLDAHGGLKLADFGIARVLERDANLTQTGMVIGTINFMPPEQLESTRTVDARADIYALGVTLYYLMTGRQPTSLHNKETHAQAFQAFPLPLARVLQRTTRFNAEDRYQTCDALVKDLKALVDFLDTDPVVPFQPPTGSRPMPTLEELLPTYLDPFGTSAGGVTSAGTNLPPAGATVAPLTEDEDFTPPEWMKSSYQEKKAAAAAGGPVTVHPTPVSNTETRSMAAIAPASDTSMRPAETTAPGATSDAVAPEPEGGLSLRTVTAGFAVVLVVGMVLFQVLKPGETGDVLPTDGPAEVTDGGEEAATDDGVAAVDGDDGADDAGDGGSDAGGADDATNGGADAGAEAGASNANNTGGATNGGATNGGTTNGGATNATNGGAANSAAGSATDAPPRDKGPRIISVVPSGGASDDNSSGAAADASTTRRGPPTGFVLLRTVPSGATVTERGKAVPVGVSGGYELTVGSHVLDVRSASGETTQLPVFVAANQTVEVCYSFDTNSACGITP